MIHTPKLIFSTLEMEQCAFHKLQLVYILATYYTFLTVTCISMASLHSLTNPVRRLMHVHNAVCELSYCS